MKRPPEKKRKKGGGLEEGKEVTKYSPQMVVREHTEARKQRFETAIRKSCYVM
jgi:hypothetical protein